MSFNAAGKKLFIKPGCIVCKTCEFTAPAVFEVKEKGLSAEVLRQPSPEELKAVLEAIKLCPETVIAFKKVSDEPA